MDASCELRIASALYEGVADTQQWQRALRMAARAVDTDRCALLARDRDTDQVRVIEMAGLSDALLAEYEAHYHRIDEVLPSVDRLPSGNCLLDQRDIGVETMQRSPFYQDFLHPHGIGSLMVTRTLHTEDTEWSMSFQRGTDQGYFEPEHEQILLRMLPHFRRALKLRVQLGELEQRARLGRAALDTFATPLLLCSMAGRVLLANDGGEAWFRRAGAQVMNLPAWRRLLTRATASAGMVGALADAHRLPDGTLLIALPAPASLREAAGRDEPLALILVHTHLTPRPVPHGVLRELFRLSAAECRLLDCLVNGATLAQAAAQLGIALETARTQSKAVLQKTGAQRQAALLRMISVLQSPAPH
ncbi:transcriptional regulator [Bordetella genomosp. 1]|uniref:Transcriptional regulator n=1 Tax=Bordetella genomosp. 1 TaxID=1395607 RepID=A0A261RT30_9BORD|nr:transcriptional regulator [Bordetella genomosp. 1]MDQ8030586.1 transcriptional regulator [Bordetella sp.]OZI28199.1 transcriptional regulator [Bordetella genomosp. 1]OZI68293.1 transcriptional regulator [Bordetella genomosp. 1]